jgi:hypothetical protein
MTYVPLSLSKGTASSHFDELSAQMTGRVTAHFDELSAHMTAHVYVP